MDIKDLMKLAAKEQKKKLYKGEYITSKKDLVSFEASSENLLGDLKSFKKETKEKAKNIIGNISTVNVSDTEAKYLVRMYYQMQKERILLGNRSLKLCLENSEDAILKFKETHPDITEEQMMYYLLPHNTSRFLSENFLVLEEIMRVKLDEYAKSRPEGRWLQSIPGIGPVLSAGLLANCRMEYKVYDNPLSKDRKVIGTERVKYAGQLQRYAGMDPTIKWNKNEVRPWNSDLKTLVWKCEHQFVLLQNSENDFYGKFYKKALIEYTRKNNSGAYADRCKEILESKEFKKVDKNKKGYDTAYSFYKKGYLPKGHLASMAGRWVGKLLLSHIHTVFYQHRFHEKSPNPYAFAVLNHDWGNYIAPPNYDEEHCAKYGLYYINPNN